MLYLENSFYFSIGMSIARKNVVKICQLEIRRIQKCYIHINTMTDLVTEMDNNCEEDSDDNDPEFLFEIQWFMNIVAALVFKGLRLKYLLVEYSDLRNNESLAKGLSPLSLLIYLRLAHFRSIKVEIFPYFRCLKSLITSERLQLFSDMNEF